MQSNRPSALSLNRTPGLFDLRSANGERRAKPPRQEGRQRAGCRGITSARGALDATRAGRAPRVPRSRPAAAACGRAARTTPRSCLAWVRLFRVAFGHEAGVRAHVAPPLARALDVVVAEQALVGESAAVVFVVDLGRVCRRRWSTDVLVQQLNGRARDPRAGAFSLMVHLGYLPVALPRRVWAPREGEERWSPNCSVCAEPTHAEPRKRNPRLPGRAIAANCSTRLLHQESQWTNTIAAKSSAFRAVLLQGAARRTRDRLA
jgi:hypothetical protein